MIDGFMFLVSKTNQIVHILLKLVYIEVFSFMELSTIYSPKNKETCTRHVAM